GVNTCFSAESPTQTKNTSCGIDQSSSLFLSNRAIQIGDNYYFVAFADTTTRAITLTLADNSTHELQPVANAADGKAVFFGTIPVAANQLGRPTPRATLYDANGTQRSLQMPVSATPPSITATSTTTR